ncbi:hypothetical protein [Pseudoxanthomonas dokdonensis]|nr:hypothetical protein [Pseudoxanthomonas dokdonensis]
MESQPAPATGAGFLLPAVLGNPLTRSAAAIAIDGLPPAPFE